MSRSEKITIMTKEEATKKALREQSYGFGSVYAGTGSHKQNNRNGGLSEEQLLEQEILANTRFRNKDELQQALSSTNWDSDITLQRLSVTIPSFGRKWNELSLDQQKIALKAAEYGDKLQVLLASTMRNIKSNTESELLRLGFTCNEVYRMKDVIPELNDAITVELQTIEPDINLDDVGQEV